MCDFLRVCVKHVLVCMARYSLALRATDTNFYFVSIGLCCSLYHQLNPFVTRSNDIRGVKIIPFHTCARRTFILRFYSCFFFFFKFAPNFSELHYGNSLHRISIRDNISYQTRCYSYLTTKCGLYIVSEEPDTDIVI